MEYVTITILVGYILLNEVSGWYVRKTLLKMVKLDSSLAEALVKLRKEVRNLDSSIDAITEWSDDVVDDIYDLKSKKNASNKPNTTKTKKSVKSRPFLL
jgi:hypothetical protein